jgi:hypothetical protein
MIYVVIALVFAVLGGLVAYSKGSSIVLWALVCAVTGPFGLLAAVLFRVERDEPRRQCPGCGKIVPLHDALCTRCGTELEWTDQVLPPESAGAAR